MILDALLRLSDNQALTAGTVVSTNSVDLGDVTPKRDVGIGEPIAIIVAVDVAPDGTTDTFSFDTIGATNGALTAGVVQHVRRTIPKAKLVAGALVVLDVPPGMDERYLGVRYVVGAGDTISVSAFVVPRSFIQYVKNYARGYVID